MIKLTALVSIVLFTLGGGIGTAQASESEVRTVVNITSGGIQVGSGDLGL